MASLRGELCNPKTYDVIISKTDYIDNETYSKNS